MKALHWFRSDLRIRDNVGLAAAAKAADELALLFVFDDALLKSRRQGAPRVRYLRACLESLAADLEERGNILIVRRGDPRVILPELAAKAGVTLVTWNRDYPPYATARDAAVSEALAGTKIEARTFKDRVIYESREVLSQQDRPYAVYSPYRKAWWKRLAEQPLGPTLDPALPGPVGSLSAGTLPSPAKLGAGSDRTELPPAGEAAALERLESFLEETARGYTGDRDRPDREGTSRLSPHLRFGTISVRECIRRGQKAARRSASREGTRKWMDELVWREFYHAILAEHPRVLRESYRSEFDAVRWENDEKLFEAWCRGETGYPFVDAGMRELNATGVMHNRARMVVASFLTKDLLIDWRWGEHYFMQRLVDGDPASNNGGWQWAASTGTDAQPFFRIFNPVSQGERFDPEGEYVRRWIPELRGLRGKRVHRPWDSPLEAPEYPPRVVDHAERRERALALYEAARGARP